MKTEYKNLRFDSYDNEQWHCIDKESDTLLGWVYNPCRQFVIQIDFDPDCSNNCVLSAGQCGDIKSFLDQLNRGDDVTKA